MSIRKLSITAVLLTAVLCFGGITKAQAAGNPPLILWLQGQLKSLFQQPSAVTGAATCTDSDGGLNYFVRGTINGNSGYTDYCFSNGSGMLYEYMCDPANPPLSTHKTYLCPNGCRNGACIGTASPAPAAKLAITPTPTPSPTPAQPATLSCTATDTGITISDSNGNQKIYTNSCQNANTQNKYTCGINQMVSQSVDTAYISSNPNCPNGCLDGVCKMSTGGPNIPTGPDDSTFSPSIPAKQAISVKYPAGGEKLNVGSQYDITWLPVGPAFRNVNIYLYNGTKLTQTIIKKAGNAGGSWAWKIPATTPAGDYKIKITNYDNGSVHGESGVFTVNNIPQALTVTSPTDGTESWQAGSKQTIAWTSAGTIPVTSVAVTIFKGKSIYKTIVDKMDNTGTYDWVIPANFPAGSYKIRIYKYGVAAIHGDSNNNFTITTATSILSESQNNGVIGSSTQPANLSCVSTDTGIIISDSNGNQKTYTNSCRDANTQNKYGCDINQRVSQSIDTAYILSNPICPNGCLNGACKLSATQSPITVTSPKAGDTLTQGQKYTLTWTAPNISTVTISLLKSSLTTSTIAFNIANTGSFDWTVPTNLSGSGFQLYVSAVGVLPARSGTFTIAVPGTNNAQPAITVTSPNGGQALPFGNTMVIPVSWTIINAPAQYGINLIILNSNGGTVGNIGGILTNNVNSYNWGYALQPGQYKIKAQVCTIGATEEAGPICGTVLSEDTSDNYFTIATAGTGTLPCLSGAGPLAPGQSYCSTQPAITVTSPNGGTENWKVGEAHSITWTSSGIVGSAVLGISIVDNNDATLCILPAGYLGGNNGSNTASFNFNQCPASIIGTNKKIKVSYNGAGSVTFSANGYSNPFTIAAPGTTQSSATLQVNLISPYPTAGGASVSVNGGVATAYTVAKTLNAGSTFAVTANAVGGYATSLSGCTLASPGAVAGQFYTCSITYTQTGTTTQPSISVTSPNGGTLTDGTPTQILWTSSNAPAGSTVGIQIMGIVNGAFESWGYSVGGFNNPTSGSISWTPRVLRQSGEQYQIRATLFASGAANWNSTTLATNLSPAFTINLPQGATRSLAVNSPIATDILQAGKTYPITWQTAGISSSDKIKLSYEPKGQSTEVGGPVIATVSNSGSYQWTVPVNITPGQYRIEADYINEYEVYGAIGDSAYFTISASGIPQSMLSVSVSSGATLPGSGAYVSVNGGAPTRLNGPQISLNVGDTFVVTAASVSGYLANMTGACNVSATSSYYTSVSNGANYNCNISYSPSAAPTACNNQHQCVANGGGSPCSTNTDCTTAATYTITYNGNGKTGGAVPVDSNKYIAGSNITALGNTGNLVKTGYTFSGWNTVAAGNGNDYAVSSTFAMGSSNIILYAKWTANAVACNKFTYSAWSGCKDGIQTRTVVSRLPANCAGGNPVLTQSCGLFVSCFSPETGTTNYPGTKFASSVSGGTNLSYAYLWSGACNGNKPTCTAVFSLSPSTFSSADYTYTAISGSGLQTATVTVTSGTETATATCSVDITVPPDSSYPSVVSSDNHGTVSAPSGGQNWTVGSTQTIIWYFKGSNPPKNIKIDLLKSGVLYQTINPLVSAALDKDGYKSLKWAIPADLPIGSDYQIKISDVDNPSFFYVGYNGYFNIVAPAARCDSTSTKCVANGSGKLCSTAADCGSFNHIYPAGGESFVLGDTVSIQWGTYGYKSPVKIDLMKGDAVVQNIINSAADKGKYNWKITPDLATGTDYKILITSTGAAVSISSGNFSINSQIVLSVILPKGGEVWTIGEKNYIYWKSNSEITVPGKPYFSPGEKVKIDLMKGETIVKTITSPQYWDGNPGGGVAAWVLPADLPTGTGYTIRVSDKNSNISATSADTFSVVAKVSMSPAQQALGSILDSIKNIFGK